MYQTKVNNQFDFNIENEDGTLSINSQKMNWDVKMLPNGSFSILSDNNSYTGVVENIDKENKVMTIKVNQRIYNVSIKEPIDQQLAKMGLNMAATKKAEPIKAPMPGLILKIMVTPGQQIKKGEPVLILEAMKMENVFKAPADAVVKSIKTEERKAVEKGEVLIELE